MRFHYAEGLSSQIYRFFANIRPVRLRNRIAAAGRGGARCGIPVSPAIWLICCCVIFYFVSSAERAGRIRFSLFILGLGLSSSSAPIRGRKSFTVRIFSLSLLSMHKWLTILLACIAVLSGGGEVTASASSAVKRSVAVASQPASQEREFRVGRQRLVDSIAEYASNPAHSDCGPETFGRLLRCPVTAPSGIHFMRCGGLSEVSSDDVRCRIFSHFNTRIPCAVLHPVDYYVFRMRRLLI